MPKTSLRLLRAHLEQIGDRPPELTEAQRARQERIVAASTSLFVRFGPDTISLSDLALALRHDTRTVRRHFADLETILFEILTRHLLGILKALGEIPNVVPDAEAIRRARYVELCHYWGSPNEPHFLLLQHRHFLPEENRRTVENLHYQIGLILAPDHPWAILEILDAPGVDFAAPGVLEAKLAALRAPAPPTESESPPDTAASVQPASVQPASDPATQAGFPAAAPIPVAPNTFGPDTFANSDAPEALAETSAGEPLPCPAALPFLAAPRPGATIRPWQGSTPGSAAILPLARPAAGQVRVAAHRSA